MGKIRKIFCATLIGAALYASGVFTSNKAQDAAFHAVHPGAKIEQGYCQDFGGLCKKRVVNQNGNIETYLVDSRGKTLPCFEGEMSIQVGTYEYVMQNMAEDKRALAIDNGYRSLKQQRPRAATSLSTLVWQDLTEEQRLDLVIDNYSNLSPEKQEQLADGLLSRCYSNKWEYFKRSAHTWWDNLTNQGGENDGR